MLQSLEKSESGETTFSGLTKKEFESFVNKKRIKKIARKKDMIWQFRPSYSTREMNQELFNGCQSLDTFKVFLAENFQIVKENSYMIVTDFASTIEVCIKSRASTYRFE